MFLHVKLFILRADGIIPSPNNFLALKFESESKKMRATDLLSLDTLIYDTSTVVNYDGGSPRPHTSIAQWSLLYSVYSASNYSFAGRCNCSRCCRHKPKGGNATVLVHRTCFNNPGDGVASYFC